MKKKNFMNKTNLLVFTIMLVFIVIIAGIFFYNSYVIKEVKTLYMQVEISDRVAFKVNPDAIWFGKILPGGSSKRDLTLTNNYNYPLVVSIKITGDIAPYASVSANNFIMQAHESRPLTYYAKSHAGQALGNLTGYTKISFKRSFSS